MILGLYLGVVLLGLLATKLSYDIHRLNILVGWLLKQHEATAELLAEEERYDD